jgi:hypothetical protein
MQAVLQEGLQQVEMLALSREAYNYLEAIDAGETDGVSCWRSPSVVRRDGSDIEGVGLFAEQDIAANTLIAVKQGRVVDRRTVKDNTEVMQGSHQQIGPDQFLAGLTAEEVDKNLIGYNHSCVPNAKVVLFEGVPLSFVVTDKPIAKGDEITVDYSLSQATDTHALRRCQCGNGDRCRDIIMPAYDWMTPEYQVEHEGDFAWHIRDKINELNSFTPERKKAALDLRTALMAGEFAGLQYDEIKDLERRKQEAVSACPVILRPLAEMLFKRQGYDKNMEARRQSMIDAALVFFSRTPARLAECGIDAKEIFTVDDPSQQMAIARRLVEDNIPEVVEKTKLYSYYLTW